MAVVRVVVRREAAVAVVRVVEAKEEGVKVVVREEAAVAVRRVDERVKAVGVRMVARAVVEEAVAHRMLQSCHTPL